MFAQQLAGGVLAAAGCDIVLAQWADRGGHGEQPLYIAPLHVHHSDDEAWYVLEGSLGIRLGDRDVVVPAGGAAIAPRGTPHTYWNPADGPARYLLVMTPTIYALIKAIHAMPERTSSALRAVFEKHDSQLLDR